MKQRVFLWHRALDFSFLDFANFASIWELDLFLNTLSNWTEGVVKIILFRGQASADERSTVVQPMSPNEIPNVSKSPTSVGGASEKAEWVTKFR